jgi:hypothetical protein
MILSIHSLVTMLPGEAHCLTNAPGRDRADSYADASQTLSRRLRLRLSGGTRQS